MEFGMSNIYIIELTGGLGNQMYQYSLYKYLKQKRIKCYLHSNDFYIDEHSGNKLLKVFHEAEQDFSSSYFIHILSKLYIKLAYIRGVLKFHLPYLYTLLLNILPYRFIIFPTWKNYTFLSEIKELRDLFRFPPLDTRNAKIAKEMKETESISIHIRRGDYQTVKKWRINLGDICDNDYYLEVLKNIKMRLESKPSYFIFSDDIGWARRELSLEGATYVDWNTGGESYRDMQLMTYCKYNVCANSTFSLLAAWLNKNSSAKVYLPSKWINQHKDTLFDLYVPIDKNNWYIIDNKKPQISIICKAAPTKVDLKYIKEQSYTDYEFLCSEIPKDELDERFRQDTYSTRGNYVLTVDNYEYFRDSEYLRTWILSQYTDCIE